MAAAGSSRAKKPLPRKKPAPVRRKPAARRPAPASRRTRRKRQPTTLEQLRTQIAGVELTTWLYLASAGFALALAGLAGDVWMHRADTHLASHETPLTLGNLTHVMLMAGIATAVLGTAAALFAAGGHTLQALPGQLAVGLLALSALVGIPAVYLDNTGHPEAHEADMKRPAAPAVPAKPSAPKHGH